MRKVKQRKDGTYIKDPRVYEAEQSYREEVKFARELKRLEVKSKKEEQRNPRGGAPQETRGSYTPIVLALFFTFIIFFIERIFDTD